MNARQQLEALCILHNMAIKRTGWRSLFNRWWINDEPLRNDAARLIREVGYHQPMPIGCRIVGDANPAKAGGRGMTGKPEQPLVQSARAETRQKDWNALREAIHGRADHEEIERLWDRCERWL